MRYSVITSAPPAEVLRRARASFGPSGAGLRLVDQGMLSARFAAAPGFVGVEARRDGGATEVVIETRAFDDDVLRFIAALPRQSWLGDAWERIRAKFKHAASR